MQKVLRVKVNVLIENNRLQLQKKEKELLQARKRQEKYSYSHYEEPSLQLAHPYTSCASPPALPRDRSVPTLPHERCPTDSDPDLFFQKRFEEIEKTNYRKQSMENLQKEQYYLCKILQNLQEKRQRIGRHEESVVVLPKVSRDKENTHLKYRLQKGEKQNTLEDSQNTNESRDTNKSCLSTELARLQAEHAHLEAELARFSQQNTDNLELTILQLERELEEAGKLVEEGRREVGKLKAGISSDSKRLIKSTLNEDQVKSFCDQISALKAELLKRSINNKEKSSYLRALLSKSETQAEQPCAAEMLSVPAQDSGDIATVSTVKTTHSTKVTKKSAKKLKQLTTLEMERQLTPQEQVDFLLKKKQAIAKATEAESRKWKQAYTEKMRKLISGCSNVKELQALSSKLEGEREDKTEEIAFLKHRIAVTDS